MFMGFFYALKIIEILSGWRLRDAKLQCACFILYVGSLALDDFILRSSRSLVSVQSGRVELLCAIWNLDCIQFRRSSIRVYNAVNSIGRYFEVFNTRSSTSSPGSDFICVLGFLCNRLFCYAHSRSYPIWRLNSQGLHRNVLNYMDFFNHIALFTITF